MSVDTLSSDVIDAQSVVTVYLDTLQSIVCICNTLQRLCFNYFRLQYCSTTTITKYQLIAD